MIRNVKFFWKKWLIESAFENKILEWNKIIDKVDARTENDRPTCQWLDDGCPPIVLGPYQCQCRGSSPSVAHRLHLLHSTRPLKTNKKEWQWQSSEVFPSEKRMAMAIFRRCLVRKMNGNGNLQKFSRPKNEWQWQSSEVFPSEKWCVFECRIDRKNSRSMRQSSGSYHLTRRARRPRDHGSCRRRFPDARSWSSAAGSSPERFLSRKHGSAAVQTTSKWCSS